MDDVEDFRIALKKLIEEKIKPLEERLKVKSGFFEDLLLKEKNDWSFIIKLHSIVEAAVSHYLSVEIGNNKLESVFQKLPLSAVNGGKIDFLKALDLLKEHRGFIVLLSRIRNDYVHVVANIGLRFEEYFKSNEENFKTLVNIAFKKIYHERGKIVANSVVKKIPKFAIWFLTMLLLIEAYEGIRPKGLPISMGLRHLYKHETFSR
jgi:hypothetical protein